MFDFEIIVIISDTLEYSNFRGVLFHITQIQCMFVNTQSVNII